MSREQVEGVLGLAKARRQELQAVYREGQFDLEQQTAKRAEVEAQAEAARQELLKAILPGLYPEAMDRALALCGYAPLRDKAAIFKALEDDKVRLQTRLAEIAADERFTRREELTHPNTGTLTRRVAELVDYMAGFQKVVASCQHPRFEHLLSVGYGTPNYAVPFWRLSYYNDWKAGDEILERFTDKQDFGQIVAAYTEAEGVLQVFKTELAELRGQVAECEALAKEHMELSARFEDAAARHLEDLRGRIASFIRDMGIAAIGDRLSADPEVELLAKRWDGLCRKAEYLEGLTQAYREDLARAGQEMSKMDRTITKWSRPKALYLPVTDDLLKKVKTERGIHYRQRLQKRQKQHALIFGFNDYHHGRLASDFLWWDLFTDGRIDGDFLPDVQRFRREHPNYRYQRLRSEAEAEAAAAVAALDREDAAAHSADIS